MEVGHGSHLVILLSNVLVTKPSENGTGTDVTVLQPNPTSNPLFVCLRRTVTKKEEEKKIQEKLRPFLHIPQRGTTVESNAEL